jgi:hypothetical protein
LIGSSKQKLAIKSELLEEGQRREAVRKEHLMAVEKKSQRTIKTFNSREENSNNAARRQGANKSFPTNNSNNGKSIGGKLSNQGNTERDEALLEAPQSLANVAKRNIGSMSASAKGNVKKRLQRVISKIQK